VVNPRALQTLGLSQKLMSFLRSKSEEKFILLSTMIANGIKDSCGVKPIYEYLNSIHGFFVARDIGFEHYQEIR
jgi:hypothetical protein